MIKKLGTTLLAAVLAMLMVVPAFAQEEEKLSASSLTLKVGETAKISAYTGSQAAEDVMWSSSNTSAAMVDGWGNVTGLANGRSTVSAKFQDGKKLECLVLVGTGGELPQNVVARGIDVSEHNSEGKSPINWSTVRSAGYDFAMLRTGYGSEDWDNQTDAYFKQYYQDATQAGLKVGAYHYSYATNVTMAAQEAEFCLHILGGRPMDYPVVYDVENSNQAGLSAETLGQMVDAFCSRIQQAGYKAAVYSFVDFYQSHLTSPLVRKYDLWIARTGGASSPGISVPYTMWQYATESVPGVDGACDVDYSFYDYAGGGTVTPVQPEEPSVPSSPSFACDTSFYSFGDRKSYIYKITTSDTAAPTAESSNPSAVSVSLASPTSGGYLFTITNHGAGEATITTTSADKTRTASFQAVGSAPQKTFESDTPLYFTMTQGSTYQFKLTGKESASYRFASGNPSILREVSTTPLGGGSYYYKIRAVGTGTAGLYANSQSGDGIRFCIVTVKPSAQSVSPGTEEIKSDTPYYFTMKKGKTYQFKLTGAEGVPYTFVCGNQSILKTVSVRKIDGSYYYKIRADGAGTAGVYANPQGGKGTRFCIVTVQA